MVLLRETRWQSFRQQHRHRPLKLLLHLLGMLVLIVVYSYTFFRFQPERSYQHIVVWNAVMENKTIQYQAEIAKARRRRRQKPQTRDRPVDMEYVDGSIVVTDTIVVPKEKHTIKRNSTETREERKKRLHEQGRLPVVEAFLRVFLSMAAFTCITIVLRMYLHLSVYPRLRQQGRLQESRQDRFHAWVARLNRQRQQNGQQPMSHESLRLVMQDRDFMDGNDYDRLLQFDEEAGPAVEALLNSMGATQEEIDRCPSRTITSSSDELLKRPTSESIRPPHCAICLEQYRLHDTIRTIPCFHSFHKDCIDQWLTHKALCPVCKHPAVA